MMVSKMAKIGDLIPATAVAVGASDNPVREKARRVREAGYIQTGSAGRYGGAEMTEWDAANLLLGLTCSEQAKDAGAAVQRYRHLFLSTADVWTKEVREPHPDHPGMGRVTIESLCPEPMRWLGETAQGLLLGDVLDRLIGMARTGELQALFRELVIRQGVPDNAESIAKAIGLGMVHLKLEFQRPRPGGTIVFGERHARPYLSVEFGHLSALESVEELDALQTGDLIETAKITHRTIFALGEVLRQ
jgi:hypothetical protein